MKLFDPGNPDQEDQEDQEAGESQTGAGVLQTKQIQDEIRTVCIMQSLSVFASLFISITG